MISIRTLRPLLPLLVLALLASCSPRASGSLEPLPEGEVGAALGLDLAAARQTVLTFLHGYANAAKDEGFALSEVVGTRSLANWVHWLNVQNESLKGELDGTVDLRELSVARPVNLEGTVGLILALDATVSLRYVPPEGEPVEVRHDFTGPVTLIRRGAGLWLVADIVRDGQSMAGAMRTFSRL